MLIILFLPFLQNRIKYSEDMYEVPCLAKVAKLNEKVGSGTFLVLQRFKCVETLDWSVL